MANCDPHQVTAKAHESIIDEEANLRKHEETINPSDVSFIVGKQLGVHPFREVLLFELSQVSQNKANSASDTDEQFTDEEPETSKERQAKRRILRRRAQFFKESDLKIGKSRRHR